MLNPYVSHLNERFVNRKGVMVDGRRTEPSSRTEEKGSDLVLEPIENDTFSFACHKELTCFTDCCGRLDLRLSPYDIVRLKGRLGISSGDFLENYTVADTDASWRVPIVKLSMGDDERKRCPFVEEEGCVVYEDRPGACRTYPLGRAASRSTGIAPTTDRYFLVREDHCVGFRESRRWTVDEWLRDQGIEEYNRMNDRWLEIVSAFGRLCEEGPHGRRAEMFSMVCYDLDRFRAFVFGSKFLTLFDVPEKTVEALRDDDAQLLSLGFAWLMFSLTGKGGLKLRTEVQEARKKELGLD